MLYNFSIVTFVKSSLQLILLGFLIACQAQKNETVKHQFSNELINETSPYLLQHAHNPVDWKPWGDEAFEEAKKENKLVIISIGYSACHWCHVMEHETFEDSTAAALMNENFISIKVDREERPDVDQVYMTAVQLMTKSGGWPLNVVTLADGRPIWGGTYFPKESWMQVLQQIAQMQKDEPEKILEYATKLTEGVIQTELVQPNTAPPNFSTEDAQMIFSNWKKNFDGKEGGPNRAPKFPLPNNYEYLLAYGQLSGNTDALDHVELTLQKMAHGGIYDQVGGGFARYSTDADWIAPHFEKMLYDNAQLVSLYSKAFQKFKNPLYKEIVEETTAWLERELTGPDGEFYSALDADSEGEEGKFYVWSKDELQAIIPTNEWGNFEQYYDLKKGEWEGKIILQRSDFDPSEANYKAWIEKAENWKQALLKERAKRIRPGLDDKSLTSWNGLMITGLVDAYKAFPQHEEYLERAEKCAKWLLKNQAQADGSLLHSYKKGTSSIEGLIEDYTFSIQAFLSLFEVTFDEKYLEQAEAWLTYSKANFEDEATSLFYMRSLKSKQLIAKSLETTDNVIPASNSAMAKNLFLLGHYLDKEEYRMQAINMLNQVDKERMLTYGDNYSNWAQLLLSITYPYYEIAISGKGAHKKYLAFQQSYHPNVLWIGATKQSDLALLQNRFAQEKTMIYVCQDKVCQLPVEEVNKATQLLQ